MDEGFYGLSASTLKHERIDFDRYRGKVVLVVNTASKCGLTPQYEGLESLYRKYKDAGLEILGFPCNQFGNQEPGDAQSIEQGCMLNYGVSFQMFDKVEVNGKAAHPVFVWLRSRFPGRGRKTIKWNFTKFLLDREGRPVKRFEPLVKPEAIEPTITSLLEASGSSPG